MKIDSFIEEASWEQVDRIVSFLSDMQVELEEFTLDRDVAKNAVRSAMQENVQWFLFKDEKGDPFGTCYLQSVHNYWRKGRRFYLGAFYISPPYRKKGRFKKINALLKKWATAHDGVQIYAHIHKDNAKALATFASVDVTPINYVLCANHWGDGGPHGTTVKGGK